MAAALVYGCIRRFIRQQVQNPDAEPGHSLTPPKVKAVMTSHGVEHPEHAGE